MVVISLVLVALGYCIGVYDERNHGQAAAEKAMKQEIEEFKQEVREWNAIEDAVWLIDHEPASKRIQFYGVRK